MNPAITVKTAAEMLGIHEQTLRAWEADGKVTSTRTEGGHRRFYLSEIERLQAEGLGWEPQFMIKYDNYEVLPDRIKVIGHVTDMHDSPPNRMSSHSYIMMGEFRKTMDTSGLRHRPFNIILRSSTELSDAGIYRCKMQPDVIHELWEFKDGILTLSIRQRPNPADDWQNLPQSFWDHNVWEKVPRRLYGEEAVRTAPDMTEIRWVGYERVSLV